MLQHTQFWIMNSTQRVQFTFLFFVCLLGLSFRRVFSPHTAIRADARYVGTYVQQDSDLSLMWSRMRALASSAVLPAASQR